MGRTCDRDRDRQWKLRREVVAVANRLIETGLTNLAKRNWHTAETRDLRVFWGQVEERIHNAAAAGAMVRK